MLKTQVKYHSIFNNELSTHKSIIYSQKLVSIASITPHDNGCQKWVASKLEPLGFEIDSFEMHGVTNLIAHYKHGQNVPCFAFSGHTDVVPPGDKSLWRNDPFSGRIMNERIIGRGIADMKGAVAAMLAAIEDFFDSNSKPHCDLLFLLTSDEEGEAQFGTKEIKKRLNINNIKIDYCLVGEPTSKSHIGDTIKLGRRGAISANISYKGKQGHVAYPQYANNAIDKATDIVASLNSIEWDQGSDDFPGTSLQVTYINSGQETDNIIPGKCDIGFNIRYSHRFSQNAVKELVNNTLRAYVQADEIQWQRACEPYFTEYSEFTDKNFIAKIEQSIVKLTGIYPVLSTSGGTSDGRFLSDEHTQVIELGLKNHSIHQINEHADIKDIIQLQQLYHLILMEVFN